VSAWPLHMKEAATRRAFLGLSITPRACPASHSQTITRTRPPYWPRQRRRGHGRPARPAPGWLAFPARGGPGAGTPHPASSRSCGRHPLPELAPGRPDGTPQSADRVRVTIWPGPAAGRRSPCGAGDVHASDA